MHNGVFFDSSGLRGVLCQGHNFSSQIFLGEAHAKSGSFSFPVNGHNGPDINGHSNAAHGIGNPSPFGGILYGIKAHIYLRIGNGFLQAFQNFFF